MLTHWCLFSTGILNSVQLPAYSRSFTRYLHSLSLACAAVGSHDLVSTSQQAVRKTCCLCCSFASLHMLQKLTECSVQCCMLSSSVSSGRAAYYCAGKQRLAVAPTSLGKICFDSLLLLTAHAFDMSSNQSHSELPTSLLC